MTIRVGETRRNVERNLPFVVRIKDRIIWLIGDLKEQSNGAGGVEGGGDVSLTTYIVHGLTGGNEAYTRSGTMYRLNLS